MQLWKVEVTILSQWKNIYEPRKSLNRIGKYRDN